MAMYCADGASDDDGGRWGEATADGGEVAYLRHAEVGVEENPGTLRCALRTGLRKSAVALRRESANRGMTFLQPLFGGRCEWIGCHPQNIKTMRQFNLLVLGILGTFVNSFKIRMLL